MLIFLILQCIICENPSLLVESTELGELSTFKELVKLQERVRMRNLVHNIVCDEDGDHCRLSSRKHKRFSCTDCKEKERIFREVLLKKFHDEGIESVNFIQWDFNYGRQREAHEMDIKSFVDKFLEDMNLYMFPPTLVPVEISYVIVMCVGGYKDFAGKPFAKLARLTICSNSIPDLVLKEGCEITCSFC